MHKYILLNMKHVHEEWTRKAQRHFTYHFVLSLAESNALGSFVHIEKRPHTMTGAVVKVQTQIPQRQTRDAVKAGAQSSLGKH